MGDFWKRGYVFSVHEQAVAAALEGKGDWHRASQLLMGVSLLFAAGIWLCPAQGIHREIWVSVFLGPLGGFLAARLFYLGAASVPAAWGDVFGRLAGVCSWLSFVVFAGAVVGSLADGLF